MFTDITGIRRYKIGLHTHTSRTDGRLSYEEVLALYAEAGYDMLAVTDHWVWNGNGIYEYQKSDSTQCKTAHMTILSGCEYNVGGSDAAPGVYHILALCCTRQPDLTIALRDDPSLTVPEKAGKVVQAIRDAGGLAVLAHPAWSLNTLEQVKAMGRPDATEIYNSVSACHMSDRPYSGYIVDILSTDGMYLPLLATDDSHYYDGDQCRGYILAEADAVDKLGVSEAIRQNRFFATMGPEIHLERLDEDTVRVRTSPAVKICFLSNLVWTDGRVVRGDGLTEAVYTFKENERYIRAEVTDSDGLTGFSPIIVR